MNVYANFEYFGEFYNGVDVVDDILLSIYIMNIL